MPTYGPQGHLLGLWKKNGKVTILIDADGCPVVDLTIGNTAQFPPSGLSTAPADLRAKSRRKRRLRSEAPRCGSVCGTASALPKCSIMSGCGTRIVLRGQKPLALCDRCPCFGSLYPPPAALTFAAQSIICAFGLAAAAPRSPYRHLELCGIAYTGTDYKNNGVCLYGGK